MLWIFDARHMIVSAKPFWAYVFFFRISYACYNCLSTSREYALRAANGSAL